MAPADFGQVPDLQYSFVNGLYQAIKPSDSFLGNSSEGDAMVLTGVVNGQRTLAVVFRGTDQIADFNDYVNFGNHFDTIAARLIPFLFVGA
jgi:hypothetical protein